jgi:hypothetical protein
MKSDIRCIPCITNQVMRSVLSAGGSAEKVIRAGEEALKFLSQADLTIPPNALTTRTLVPILADLKLNDPYAQLKLEEIRIGKGIYPRLKKIVADAPDRLRTAFLIAATGNIIDIGAQTNYDIETAVAEIGKKGFRIDSFDQFKERMARAKDILYILDNTGELFFDRILIEELKDFDLTACVKARPIHNDATEREAKAAGIDRFARIITTGDGSLGIDWERSGKEFLNAYQNADIVIGKGHANFESLIDGKRDSFLLLRAKCPVVAERIGIDVGDLVLYYYEPPISG